MEPNRISTSFRFEAGKGADVEAKAWTNHNNEWQWNVYAHINETHPIYGDHDKIMDLPVYKGVTFDEIRTTGPMGGLEYDWQKIHSIKTIGCDFQHLDDERLPRPSPFVCGEKLPAHIMICVQDLIEALNK